MIRSILRIQNIGLLQNAMQNGAVTLTKISGIFADNGRGKSTLASIFRACGEADAGRLNARRTIDSTGSPEIEFLLPSGAHVQFENNAWTGPSPRIVVFDAEFVEENVYSGSEVRTEQRQSLLEFALGDKAVEFLRRVDQLTQEIETQTRRLTIAQKQLVAYSAPYTIPEFIALEPIQDTQQQIENLQRRIDAAKNAQQLAVRQVPNSLEVLSFDFDAVFKILRLQLRDIEQEAETVVKKHLAQHGGRTLEDWISKGQTYIKETGCPFCGQVADNLSLIRAYRSYFNKSYTDLKLRVAALEEQVNLALSENKADRIRSVGDTNTARIEAWKDRLIINSPVIASDGLIAALKQARELLLSLIEKKRSTPLEAIGNEAEYAVVVGAMDSIKQIIAGYNSELVLVSSKISGFKKQLTAENVPTLQSQVKRLEAVIRRQEQDVLVAEYLAAESERTRLQAEKSKVREESDNLMTATLRTYQESINSLLTTFGAEFTIEELNHTSVGSGEPRTEYRLNVRNKSVKLGNRADPINTLSFATALSEADKRTLAFTFFLAKLKADLDLGGTVVVLDDPVSSLDRNRRHQSIRQIGELAPLCGQLVVLSHDAYFVRELKNYLANLKPTPVELQPIRIDRVKDGYSAFAKCDLDDICSSDYYRHHQLVADYVDGKSTVNTRDVAKAIRPLMEGYYHRRFPGKIPKNTMFGRFIELVGAATPPNPLAFLIPLVPKLIEVNDYSKQFHHDGGDSLAVNGPELLQCAKRALDLIYQNG